MVPRGSTEAGLHPLARLTWPGLTTPDETRRGEAVTARLRLDGLGQMRLGKTRQARHAMTTLDTTRQGLTGYHVAGRRKAARARLDATRLGQDRQDTAMQTWLGGTGSDLTRQD